MSLIAARNVIQHIAAGRHGAAIDVDTLVGINARIHAEAAAAGRELAAVDNQPAVGIDAVALAGSAVDDDIQFAAVHGADGDVVLIGVDAVVAGFDIDDAAVQAQVQLGIEALVLRIDVQHTVALFAAEDVHRHLGIERAVILVQLLGILYLGAVLGQFHGTGLVNARHIGAVDRVGRAVRDDDICARLGGIHGHRGGILVGLAGLIHAVENHARRHGAGDVHAVQNQRHNGVRIFLCILAQINGHLSCRQLAAQFIGAGFGDVHYGMRIGFGLLMAVRLRTLAVGEILSCQIEHDVVGHIYSRFLVAGRRSAVDRHARIGQHDLNYICLRHSRNTDHAHAQSQHQCQLYTQFIHI